MTHHTNLPMRWSLGFALPFMALLFVCVMLWTPLSAAPQFTNDPFGADRLVRPGDVTIFQVDQSTGVPRFVSGELTAPTPAADRVAAAIEFFDTNRSQFKMSDPAVELTPLRIDIDQLGNHHIRFDQVYQGLPVIGRQMIAHFNTSGVMTAVNGTFEPKIELDINDVRFDSDRAVEIASTDLESHFGKGELKEDPQLVVFPWEGQNFLAWRFFLMSSTPMGRWEYFIDAQTGEVIFNANRIMNDSEANDIGTGIGVMGDARNHIDTHQDGATYRMTDYTRQAGNNPHGHDGQMPAGNFIQTYIASTSLPGTIATDADNVWDVASSQRPAVDGQVYTGLVYDWLLREFGRNSFDDNGASMNTSVNYSAEGDNNAYWNGTQIVIWSWSSGWRSLAGCPDVIAHEWGHAVTERTSGLVYQKEPGALNESFSDMMGAAFEWAHDTLDTPDWGMGENGRTTGIPFRDMEDPAAYGDPEYYGTSDPNWIDVVGCTPSWLNDYCGVHTNSGVGNKWFQLLSDGGTHHSVTVGGIGVENAMSVAYQANSFYWNANTDYHEAALGTISAANDLDVSGDWATQVALAWNAVGVSTPAPGIDFVYPGGTPNDLVPDQPTNFDVNVISFLNGTPISGTGDLHYRIDGGIWQTVSMTENLPNEYTATLPALSCGETIEYYVSAESVESGVQNDPDPSTPYDAFPSTGSGVAFSDGFETSLGWTAQGQWARGNPSGGGGDHGNPDPQDPHTGNNVFGYNLSGDYPNNMSETHLTSPAIDCSDLSGVTLSFWRWLGVEQPAYDHAYIRVSTNGSSWTTVWENDQEIADASWTQVSYDISSVADGQSTLYIRFTMGTTDGSWQYCGWNIDDLVVSGYECSGSPADTDGDGVADVDDNCPNDFNPSQTDADTDTFGEACDCDDTDANINPNTVWYADTDGDNFGDAGTTLTQCDQPTGYVLNSQDCDDSDNGINPNTVWYADTDGDNFGDAGTTLTQCEQPTGYVLNSQDCDDGDNGINPNTVWYADTDGDNFGDPGTTLTQCEQPTGYVLNSQDCDDGDNGINPNTVWYADTDGDTYGDPGETLTQCEQPTGYVLDSQDCDDGDNAINPTTVWYEDTDGDNYGDDASTLVQCEQPTGYVLASGDCDDGDAGINPGTVWYADSDGDNFGDAGETLTQCEQPVGYVLDASDCDDSDDGINPNTVWYADTDGDTYGDPGATLTQCEQPTGYVIDSQDCDDSDNAINPTTVWYEDSDGDSFGNSEVTLVQCEQPTGYVLNADDCDDTADSITVAQQWFDDADEDGFGDPGTSIVACTPPEGFVGNGDDCDDGDDGINPNTVWYADTDGDNFGDPNNTLTQCEQPDGFVLDSQDCDDTNDLVNPNTTWYIDVDGDGYGDTTVTLAGCEGQTGFVLIAGDNCPANHNPGQEDNDTDGVGNVCDNCIDEFNPGQEDVDSNGVGDACESCCVGEMRGNLDGDPQDEVSLGDLTVMIDNLFISLAPVWCLDEGDLDSPADGEITLGDLTVLIDHLFITLEPLAPCP